MKIFVAGATGFVGRHLVRALVADGHVVRALVRPSADAEFLHAQGVEIVPGDVTDGASVERAMQRCEIAYNLAKPRGSSRSVHHAVSVVGTEHVLSAAHRAGVRRLVHCSTAGVHGRPRGLPAAEDAPLRPESVYQLYKARGEEIVRGHVGVHGTPAVIARPSAIYGPGDLRNLKLFRDVLAGRLTTIGDARHPYHLTYVDDVVQGLRLCAGPGARPGEAYFVAGEHARPLADFFSAIAEAAGVELRQRTLPARPLTVASAVAGRVLRPLGLDPPLGKTLHFFTAPRALDISKARQELDFRPQVSLEEGVRRTLEWYLEEGHLRPTSRGEPSPRGAAA